jgi:hypothetical protein
MSATRYKLFNIFAATPHTVDRSSIRNQRTRHAVVTGTNYHGVTNTVQLYKSVTALIMKMFSSRCTHIPLDSDIM